MGQNVVRLVDNRRIKQSLTYVVPYVTYIYLLRTTLSFKHAREQLSVAVMAKPLVRTLKCKVPKVQRSGKEGLGINWVSRYLCNFAAKRCLVHCINFGSGSESSMGRGLCVINPRWNAGGSWSFAVRRAYQCCRCIKKEKKKKKHSVIPSEMVTPVVQGGAGCNRLCREPP